MAVRTARPDDEPFVVGLARRFGDTRAAWRGYEEVVRGTERALHDAFAHDTGERCLFVAEAPSGERLGFAYVVTHHDFFTGEPHGHISEIATVADGSGAGTPLMQAAERWTRERGYRYVSLNVNDTNASAHAFYERRDYQPEYRHLAKIVR